MAEIKEIQEFIKESVDSLLNEEATNCRLQLDDRLAIFVGWSSGYGDEERDDAIQAKDEPDWAINAGVKVWTSDDLWTDYDYINFPFYEDGDVLDLGISILPKDKENDYEGVAQYLLDCYNDVKDLDIAEDGEIVGDVIEVEDEFDEDEYADEMEDGFWQDKIETKTKEIEVEESCKSKKSKKSIKESLNKNEIISFLQDAYDDLSHGDISTHFYDLGLESGLYIVVGLVSEGTSGDEIAVKLAINTSALQTDYDIDWEFPVYKNGNVAFVEAAISEDENYAQLASYLIKEAQAMNKEYLKGNLICESCKSRKKSKKSLKETWRADDAFNDLLHRATLIYNEGHDIGDAVWRAMDEGLIYDEDIFDLAENYIRGSEILDLFYEALYADLESALEEVVNDVEEVEDDIEEVEVEESCKSRKKSSKKLKESDSPNSIEDCQKWVDYDMKKYGKISGKTNGLIKKAGFQVVKDKYGDWEVIAGKYDESVKSKHTIR